jgi:hypothetical protein
MLKNVEAVSELDALLRQRFGYKVSRGMALFSHTKRKRKTPS